MHASRPPPRLTPELTPPARICRAEIEYFVKPGDKPHPKFVQVADLELLLFSSAEQLGVKPAVRQLESNQRPTSAGVAESNRRPASAGVEP